MHPLAEAYLSRIGYRGGAPKARSERQHSRESHTSTFALKDYTKQQEAVAAMLGGSIDRRYQHHSREVMSTLLAAHADGERAHLYDSEEGRVDAKVLPRGGERGGGCGRVIRGEPSTRDIQDAISRYVFERTATCAAVEARAACSSAASLSSQGNANACEQLFHTLDTILTSVIRLSVEYATYVSDNEARRSEATSAAVFSIRGGACETRAPSPPAAGAFDEVAASRHLLSVFALPAVRSQLQRLAWPATAALHGAVLKEVDGLFYRKGAAGRRLSQDGRAFLASAGLGESVAAVKEHLFSFPGDTFVVLRPRDRAHSVPLSAEEAARVRNSTRVVEVLVLKNGSWTQNVFPVAHAGLREAMGSPPTHVFLLPRGGGGGGRRPPRVKDDAAGPEREERRTPVGVGVRAGLWLLMAKMSQLRVLVRFLLSLEMVLHEAKAHATLGTVPQHSADEQQRMDGTLLRAMGQVVELTRQPTFGFLRVSAHGFASRAKVVPSASVERWREVTGWPALPARYASAAQLYNAMASVLRERDAREAAAGESEEKDERKRGATAKEPPPPPPPSLGFKASSMRENTPLAAAKGHEASHCPPPHPGTRGGTPWHAHFLQTQRAAAAVPSLLSAPFHLRLLRCNTHLGAAHATDSLHQLSSTVKTRSAWLQRLAGRKLALCVLHIL